MRVLTDTAQIPRMGTAVVNPGHPDAQRGPLLDPSRWTGRHRVFVGIAAAAALVAAIIEARQTDSSLSGAEGGRALMAAIFAFGLAFLALSLRGVTLPGLLLGGFFVLAGMLSWSYISHGIVVWLVLAVEGILFAVWTFPWVRTALRLPRYGTAWLGLGYWLLGVIGAVLAARWTIGAQRLAYLGVFALAAMAAIVATRRSRRDLTVGIVAAFLLAMAAQWFLGSGNALDNVHAVPDGPWGAHMEYRFWGAPFLLYHPNSTALISVLVAVRIGTDTRFLPWQRWAAVAQAVFVGLAINSRTGVALLGFTAGLYGMALSWQWHKGRRGRPLDATLGPVPSLRRAIALALVGIVAALTIVAGSGSGFATTQRYSTPGASGDGWAGVTSGRTTTWDAVIKEFKAAPWSDKVFGDTQTTRAVVIRAGTGPVGSQPNLTTDNAALGALRRGGILGVVAFGVGLCLLLWRASKRAAPAWFTIIAVGVIPTMATADWLLGGTGGTLWIFLVAAEAWVLYRADQGIDEPA